MKLLKENKNKIFIIIFMLFTIFIIGWTVSDENVSEPEQEIKEKVKTKPKERKEVKVENKKVKVDIKGEITNPGVYELTEDNNVNDVITLAGGLTKNSDTSNINLSKKLSDEMVIIVYSKEEIKQMNEKEKIICPPCNNACIEEKDETGKLDMKNEENEISDKININTATKEQLMSLTGIGESKADLIIEYRNKNGNFNNIEDIKNVQGIGESVFEKIKNQITV